MFFPRLRRRAKWVFLLLAIVFGGGFLVFGVGTGVQGTSLGDVIQDIFQGRNAAGGPSVEDARDKLAENPRDPAARLELATALQANGRTQEAIVALESYRELRPRDETALQQLATLYSIEAVKARNRAAQAQLDAQEQLIGQSVRPGSDTPFGQALSQDPITQALSQEASTKANEALGAMQAAYRKEASVYQELSLLQPDEAFVFLQLGQAFQFAGQTEEAIGAYERFLELAPDDANAPIVRQQLEQLEATSTGSSASGG